MIPITPDQAAVLKSEVIPGMVIDVFNELIALGWDGHRAIVRQTEVVELARKKLAMDSETPFDMRWLDVEPLYELTGYSVQYDKPDYNEVDGEATFRFTRAQAKGSRS